MLFGTLFLPLSIALFRRGLRGAGVLDLHAARVEGHGLGIDEPRRGGCVGEEAVLLEEREDLHCP